VGVGICALHGNQDGGAEKLQNKIQEERKEHGSKKKKGRKVNGRKRARMCVCVLFFFFVIGVDVVVVVCPGVVESPRP